MNIAFFLKPKSSVAYLTETNTVRQGLEKMHYHGYAAIPVLSEDGRYVGTASEGDFLWYIIKGENGKIKQVEIADEEKRTIQDIIRPDRNMPVRVTESMDTLLKRALDQNFVPVIDDRGFFMGIVTRQDIIRYFYEHVLKTEKHHLPHNSNNFSLFIL